MQSSAVVSLAGHDTPRSILAQNVVRLRRIRGWSQEQLAFEAGLHRTFVAHVERQARNLSLDSLEKIATAFDVEPYELLKPTGSS